MRLSGADYVALVAVYQPEGERMVKVADVGQSCENVPANALEWLLKRGKIERLVKRKEQTDG